MPLALILSLLLLSIVRLLVARRGLGGRPLPASSRAAWAAMAAVVLAALSRPLLDAPIVIGARTTLPGDAGSHLAIAQDLARGGLEHDWLPTYNGGFPFMLHYPPVGWLVTAGLLRVGVAPITAIKTLGFASLLAVPILSFELLRRRGHVRATSAAVASIALAWITPYVQFTGGWDVFLVLGLISQALVMPVVVLWVGALASSGRGARYAPLWAALAAATHPQIFAVASVTFVVAALAMWRVQRLVVVGRSVLAGGLIAAALYVPGIRSLAVPFGWPPNLSWRLTGFGPERVLPWLRDGELFDYGRAPVFTWVWLGALFIHVLEVRRSRSSRAIVAASIVTLAICMAGRAMGATLLSVVQPMRALAIVPLMAAIAIATGLDLLTRWLRVIGPASVVPALPSVLVPAGAALLLIAEVPGRAEVLHDMLVTEVGRRSGRDSCAPLFRGFDDEAVARWLAEPGLGRVAYESVLIGACTASAGAELSRAPGTTMSLTYGAGAHVGMHTVAFSRLATKLGVPAARAEALGVRTLIHKVDSPPTPPSAWEQLASSGPIAISKRVGGTDLVGLGCVTEEIRGPEPLLFMDLHRRLERTDEDLLLDHPTDLVKLSTDRALETRKVDVGACDPHRATVHDEQAGVPGVIDVRVDAEVPVDVVFRVTAFRGFEITEDGRRLDTFRVAPGFLATRVGPGRHRLTATTHLPPLYLLGVALAVGLALWLTRVGRR